MTRSAATFDVILIDDDSKKFHVIKELRWLHPDLALIDIQRFIVGVPCVVMKNVLESAAQAAKARLEKQYAEVEIRPAGEFR